MAERVTNLYALLYTDIYIYIYIYIYTYVSAIYRPANCVCYI